jgi:hypothetical protein
VAWLRQGVPEAPWISGGGSCAGCSTGMGSVEAVGRSAAAERGTQ